MKNNQYFMTYMFLLLGVSVFSIYSCKEDDENINGINTGIPVLSTYEVTEISTTTGMSGGNITSDEGFTVTVRGVCWSTSQTPTPSDNKTEDGTGAGHFTSKIKGLLINTTYYVRAYATNRNGTGYGSTMSFTTQRAESAGNFTDPRDNNVYKTVIIGDQVWMAENLRYLPVVNGQNARSNSEPSYYVYDFDMNDSSVVNAKESINYITYGVLYNWHAAIAGEESSYENPSGVQGVCPPGWHLPSNAEWIQLFDYSGGADVAGGKLKAKTHWNNPNSGATNEYLFSALPGGEFGFFDFNEIGSSGNWWSSSGRCWSIDYDDIDVSWNSAAKYYGLSVRCIRDN